MASKDTTTDKDKAGETQGEGRVLARFEAEGYRFNPHTSAWARWFFNHTTGIFFLIALLTISGTVIAAWRAGFQMSWLQTDLYRSTYRSPDYKWCRVGFREGRFIMGIYPAETLQVECSPDIKPEPIATTVDISASEYRVAKLVENTFFYHFSFSLAFIPALLIFRDIMARAPKYLRELEKAGRLKPLERSKEAGHLTRSNSAFGFLPRGWQSYADDLENALHSKWPLVSFLFWLVVVVILGNMFANTFHVYKMENQWIRFSYAMMLGATGLFTAYIIGYGLWALFITATYIRKLPFACLLDIEPGHGDGSGGLKRLGDLCFKLASIPIAPLLLIAGFTLSGITAESVIEFQLSMYIGLFVLIAAVILNFFWPLLDIHRFMLQARRNYQDAAALQMGRVEQQLRDLFQKEPLDEKQAKVLEDRLEQLNKAYPAVQQYPTWPFTVHTVIYLAASQILPILSAGKAAIELYALFG